MKKYLLLLSMISALLIFAWYHSKKKPDQPLTPTIYVSAIKVEEDTVPLEIESIGSLKAKQIDITPEIAGHVSEIYFKDGIYVEKNKPLIKLDDAIFKTKLETAKAQLLFTQSDYQRKIYLGKKGAIAQQAIDQSLSLLKEKTAALKEMSVMLQKMILKAPFSGMIGKSNINLGDYVTNGQKLVTLTDTLHLRVEYDVPEKFYPLVKIGQKVSISTSTYPDKEFIAYVSYRSPTINPENRAVSVYADIDNPHNELAAGMFVQVTHRLGKNKHALLVPSRSLTPILEGEQIYKIEFNKAYPVKVSIGKHFNEKVEILSGLNKGDVVITDGQLKVKSGSLVTIR